MTMRVLWLLLALSLTLLPAQAARHALVIGNSAYPGRLSLGENPHNDAQAIGEALAGVGFRIESLFDVRTPTQFKTAVNGFVRKLHTQDEVVFYYSGHGLQVQGKNYLVPTQALIATEAQVPEEAVSVDFVLAALTRAGTGVVIIDACRNNPYKSLFKGDPPDGLKAQSAPAGFLLAFAADEGQRAASGAGEANSPYIKHLRPLISQPSLSVFDVFTEVRRALNQESGGTQQPMFSSRLDRPYCFAGCQRTIPVAASPLVAPDPAAIEQTLELRRDERTSIQVALNSLGYPVGDADGIWGRNTRAGISAWQRAAGRPATGYLSGEDYKLLLAQHDQRQEAARLAAQQDPFPERSRRERSRRERSRRERSRRERSLPLIANRYRDHGDGTVTDIKTKTHLMWQRCSVGQRWTGSSCSGAASEISWNDAMPNERQKTWPAFAGYRNWRVPTREELRTLVYCSNGTPQKEAWHHWCSGKNYRNGYHYQRPTIDTTAFPNTPASGFWSVSASGAEDAWDVGFDDGRDYDWGGRSGTRHVR